jgi:Uncharacterized protein conserved in bacteria (DUF2200)
VSSRGTIREIGHEAWRVAQGPAGRLLVDDSTGRVCWIDATQGGGQEVVVYDPVSAQEVARHQIDTGWPDPVALRAFEDGVVYYDQRDGGDRAWRVDTGKVHALGTGASYVMDVENDVRVTLGEGGDGISVNMAGRRLWSVSAPGYDDWELSADARWLLGRRRLEGSGADKAGSKVSLWNVAAGEQHATGLPAGVVVVAASWGQGGRITYAVGASALGPFDLVTCDADLATCTTVVEKAGVDARLNPNATLTTDVVCWARVENVDDPLMQMIRYLDKLVDERAKGRSMERILRA